MSIRPVMLALLFAPLAWPQAPAPPRWSLRSTPDRRVTFASALLKRAR